MDSDDKNPDAALHVRFQMLTIYQPYDSQNPLLPDGKPNPRYTGNPVYKDIPHIEIACPSPSGLPLNIIVEPVRQEHMARFATKWNMFKMAQGDGDQITGTKLSEWPAITRSRAEELRGMKYYAVEQIANASDSQVQGLGMDGTMLRMKAQQFLKVAKDTAIAERQSAEINKLRQEQSAKDAEHAAQLKALQDQMSAFMASQTAPVMPKRKGRPPKVQEAVGV